MDGQGRACVGQRGRLSGGIGRACACATRTSDVPSVQSSRGGCAGPPLALRESERRTVRWMSAQGGASRQISSCHEGRDAVVERPCRHANPIPHPSCSRTVCAASPLLQSAVRPTSPPPVRDLLVLAHGHEHTHMSIRRVAGEFELSGHCDGRYPVQVVYSVSNVTRE